MPFVTSTIILFLILDPIGGVSCFADAVKNQSSAKRYWTLTRELLFALGLILVFNLIGEWIFNFLEIDEPSLRVASGVILFLISLKILFPTLDLEFHRHVRPGEEAWLVPLAIPTLAGPSVLATVMLFSHIEPNMVKMTLSAVTAWGATALIILASPWIAKKVNRNFLEAMERLMGMVLILLAVQRLLEGVQLFLKVKGMI